MKRAIIAALIGAIILFVYQALSWTVLPVHKDFSRYSKNQDAALSALSANLKRGGVYFLPGLPPGASSKEHEEQTAKMEGKPWAIVEYHPSYHNDMTTSMIKGLLINFFAVLVVALTLNYGAFNSFRSRFLVAAGFLVFAIFMSRLTDWNWWQTPVHALTGEIIDMVVMGLLLGVWMGWFMGRDRARVTD
jgi:hypothetical protein